MDNICRLCFSFSNQNSYKLSEESEVLHIIYSSLSLHISLDENLPYLICSDCINKIEEISYFKTKVTENQNTLNRHLNNGINDLKYFYLSLKIALKVKEELKEVETPVVEHNIPNITFKNEINEKQTIIKQEQTDFKEKFNNISDEKELLPSSKIRSTVRNKVNKRPKKKLFKKDSRSVKPAKDSALAKKNIDKTMAKENSSTTKDCTSAKENLDTAKDNKRTDSKFKCLTCFNILESRKDLVQHYRKEHGKNIDIEDSLKTCYSEIKKEGIAMYKCGKCDKECMKKKEMNRHMFAHSEVRPFVCNICGRTFKQAGVITLHGKIHAHEGTIRYKCVYKTCGYTTNSKTALKDHERKHRQDEKYRYKCDKCGKGFQIRSHLEEHENVHKGIRPFVCDICGKTYDASRYLKFHRAAVHPKAAELKRLVCKHCSLPFSSRRTLQTHLKEHGVGVLDRYLCDSCGKSLTCLDSYKAHRRLHLGEKPFSCSTCDKTFSHKKYLITHERTHTGERRYACKECGKRYTQRSTLVKHMRQHEGWEESLECSKCQRKFEYRSQVVSHEKVCGNNEELGT